MGTIRVGMIRYLNCLPFYYGLETLARDRGLELCFLESCPANLNRALAAGEIDLAPVSSIEYVQHQGDYLLLPSLAIGASSFVRSVILFSKEPLASLDGKTIALSEESRSSATLLRILLKRRFGFHNIFKTVAQDLSRILRDHEAALIIGDAALFFESDDWVYKYDLGELWREWTGTPFVFALWAVRRSFVRHDAVQLREFQAVLQENLSRNLEEPGKLLKDALNMTPEERKYVQVLGYLVNLNYGLNSGMLKGLSSFFDLAAQEGLAPKAQPLEFFE